MKKLLICLSLLILTACAHKPVATPEEVNDYLNTLAHCPANYGYTSAFDGVGKIEMHGRLAGVLGE